MIQERIRQKKKTKIVYLNNDVFYFIMYFIMYFIIYIYILYMIYDIYIYIYRLRHQNPDKSNNFSKWNFINEKIEYYKKFVYIFT